MFEVIIVTCTRTTALQVTCPVLIVATVAFVAIYRATQASAKAYLVRRETIYQAEVKTVVFSCNVPAC